jgi:hypothetical protein
VRCKFTEKGYTFNATLQEASTPEKGGQPIENMPDQLSSCQTNRRLMIAGATRDQG